jgi:hypothetical protein
MKSNVTPIERNLLDLVEDVASYKGKDKSSRERRDPFRTNTNRKSIDKVMKE